MTGVRENATSANLGRLEERGLVRREKHGISIRNSLTDDGRIEASYINSMKAYEEREGIPYDSEKRIKRLKHFQSKYLDFEGKDKFVSVFRKYPNLIERFEEIFFKLHDGLICPDCLKEGIVQDKVTRGIEYVCPKCGLVSDQLILEEER